MDLVVVFSGISSSSRLLERSCAPEHSIMKLPSERRISFAKGSFYGVLVLTVISWIYILAGSESGIEDFLSGRAWRNSGGFLKQLIGIDDSLTGGAQMAFLDLGRWIETAKLA